MVRQNTRPHRFGWVLMCSLLAVTSAVIAQEPGATAAEAGRSISVEQNVKEIIDQISEADTSLEILFRRSKLIRTKMDITRIAVSDSTIVDVATFGTREFELIGRQTGTTSLRLWLGDEEQPRTLGLLVTVVKDSAAEDRRRRECSELQGMASRLFPNSKIQLIPVADKLIVLGVARDSQEATRIMELIRQDWSPGGPGSSTVVRQASATDAKPACIIINLLEVTSEQQGHAASPNRSPRGALRSMPRERSKPTHQFPYFKKLDDSFVHGPHGFSD
ncbi:MAG: pilus assembly protein N-terminal domain-containing protein [Planctomycetales bacterium]|nr:pilus assembly protein N-terminal domain-containing protein [Planctomycetales bacterium]